MRFIVNARAHKPKQLGPSIHEYQPNRGNMLEFNNFRMVNEIELVSKSQKSHESQRFQGLKGSSSIFMLIVQVHWPHSLLMFTHQVNSSGSLFGFTPHVHSSVSCLH